MGNSIRKIMKDTISSKKGSFSIEEIRIEIIKSLKKNNFCKFNDLLQVFCKKNGFLE